MSKDSLVKLLSILHRPVPTGEDSWNGVAFRCSSCLAGYDRNTYELINCAWPCPTMAKILTDEEKEPMTRKIQTASTNITEVTEGSATVVRNVWIDKEGEKTVRYNVRSAIRDHQVHRIHNMNPEQLDHLYQVVKYMVEDDNE